MDSLESRSLGEAGDAGKGMLAAALAIAAGTQAYAAPVRFDNPAGPNHFDWTTFLDNNLDIRTGPGNQTGAYVPGVTVNADYEYGSGYYLPPGGGYFAGAAQSSVFGGAEFLRSGYYMFPIASGGLIGTGGQSFDYNGYPYADLSFYFYNTKYSTYSGLRSFLNLGLNYLGLRLTIDTGAKALETHYGWLAVEVDYVNLPETYGIGDLSMLAITDAVAWGWETTPNTPIGAGVPAPGTLGALAFGVVGVAGRGRRKKSA